MRQLTGLVLCGTHFEKHRLGTRIDQPDELRSPPGLSASVWEVGTCQ